MLPKIKYLIGYLLIFSSAVSALFVIFWWNNEPGDPTVSNHKTTVSNHKTTVSNHETTLAKKERTLLTIFTTFELSNKKPYKTFAHKMAIKNWAQFMPVIQPVLFIRDNIIPSSTWLLILNGI